MQRYLNRQTEYIFKDHGLVQKYIKHNVHFKCIFLIFTLDQLLSRRILSFASIQISKKCQEHRKKKLIASFSPPTSSKKIGSMCFHHFDSTEGGERTTYFCIELFYQPRYNQGDFDKNSYIFKPLVLNCITIGLLLLKQQFIG